MFVFTYVRNGLIGCSYLLKSVSLEIVISFILKTVTEMTESKFSAWSCSKRKT